MHQHLLRAACLALTAAAPAAAQIVPIGPFTGDNSESFETQAAAGQSGFQPCMVGRIFQNTADMCTPGANGIHITGGWSYGCQIAPRTGNWLHGSSSGSGTELTFDSPVAQFGGYFGNNTPSAGTVTVSFYDASNNLIGSPQFPFPNDCQWYWQGWQILGGAARIVVANSNNGGAYVMMEDLEASLGAGVGIGTNFCSPANANSSGLPAVISATGSTLASDADLTLFADQLPPNQFGYFLCSKVTGFVPNVGGGQGNFCLAVPFGRFVAGLQSTGAGGTLQYVVDMNNMPNHQPPQVLAGDTWYFQAWFRDVNPGNTSNLTDGLEIQFL
jgi:hypothetical protein